MNSSQMDADLPMVHEFAGFNNFIIEEGIKFLKGDLKLVHNCFFNILLFIQMDSNNIRDKVKC